jgi:hypothetical protein
MARRRPRPVMSAEWTPTLQQLVRVAHEECPHGHAQAFAAFVALAMTKVPSRGIFDPAVRGEPDMFAAIEAIARTHLGVGTARAGWKASLDAAALPFERRDEIERASLQLRSASDTAYYYAGLAFGLAFLSGYRTS